MSEYILNAKLNENVDLHVRAENLQEIAQALLFFNLADAGKKQEAVQQELQFEETAAPVAEEPKPKRARRAKESEPAQEVAAEPVVAEPEGNETAAEPTPVEEVEVPTSTASSAVSATPQEASEAVRAYGAKFGIAAARELLQKFGFAKTADITADKAGEIVAEVNAA